MHKVIDHAECYAKGAVHTNGLENFWSLFKRCIKGTHVSVEPFHLFRYLDAEAYRFNNRKTDDRARFIGVVQSVGRETADVQESDRRESAGVGIMKREQRGKRDPRTRRK